MSEEQEITVLVEFPERPGLHEASLWNLSREELEARSKEALEKAMGLIADMARRGGGLRDFTVQIRHGGTDAIVGMGIVVSMDGRVVTCAHVVRQAGIAEPRQAGEVEVGVYFPQAPGRGGEGAAGAAGGFVAAGGPGGAGIGAD